MREGVLSWGLVLQFTLQLFLCFSKCHGGSLGEISALMAPHISPIPSENPEPFLPVLGPSPMMPLTPLANGNVPVLSGLCKLNFSAVDTLLTITATDCWTSFAPYLANVVCCPQFDATLVTLIGQSSKDSGMLALNLTHSKQCLSDVEKILTSRGANVRLQKICSIRAANLTEASCPVISTDSFESIVDSSRLLLACRKIDHVNECCEQVCQNAISDAAQKIALNGMSSLSGGSVSGEQLSQIDDCKNIVLRWLASKLDPPSANSVLRGLANCKINKACPLVLPNITHVVQECGEVIRNQTTCCKAMEIYVSKLQEQSFITNVQALNCAAFLGMKLQKANVSKNIYNLCHINIKDFSLQVGSQEYGCLLPSLPSDATYDRTTGVSFICDLNDNIAAPWPSPSSEYVSTCNKTTKLPAVPKATSAQKGLHNQKWKVPLFITIMSVIKMLLL
ncbi:uncharacterized GPI-anchored protein At1g61900-like isoform X2 [Humulus lupulus]|uniref:uncharacterized GPI-anchored protein At1g61900-like isoform X2 n=1 Tax=Humulus lupulus TaxID=3486 RepID=UPI002B412D9F|nr:uncharacterized GPI-anchored protein At1g61900-like isoform X2 [Humulus lupulus]